MITPLKVLIVAEDPLVRGSLAHVVTNQPGFEVVGTTSGSALSLLDSETYRPDVILWDLGWNTSAWEPVDDMSDLSMPVLVLAPESLSIGQLFESKVAGVLDRETTPERLFAGLSAVAVGLFVVDHYPGPDRRALPEPVLSQEPVESLTSREGDVLRLLAEGLPNKTIALRLGISDHTVKFHITSIMGKLGAQSRTEAVVLATRLGWLHL